MDKEDRYIERYKNGQVCTNIWQYIPYKVMEGVTNAFADSDGYWIWLDYEEGGWVAYDGGEDCGIIHEFTMADLKEAIKTIRKVKR